MLYSQLRLIGGFPLDSFFIHEEAKEENMKNINNSLIFMTLIGILMLFSENIFIHEFISENTQYLLKLDFIIPSIKGKHFLGQIQFFLFCLYFYYVLSCRSISGKKNFMCTKRISQTGKRHFLIFVESLKESFELRLIGMIRYIS